MTYNAKLVRAKYTPAQHAQIAPDIAVICQVYGTLTFKYLAMIAIHLWANRIRAGHTEIEIDLSPDGEIDDR